MSQLPDITQFISGQPLNSRSNPVLRSANHPVEPFATRRDHPPPSTPNQRLKPTQAV